MHLKVIASKKQCTFNLDSLAPDWQKIHYERIFKFKILRRHRIKVERKCTTTNNVKTVSEYKLLAIQRPQSPPFRSVTDITKKNIQIKHQTFFPAHGGI